MTPRGVAGLEVIHMPHYIRLTNLTRRGFEHIEDSTDRIEHMNEEAEDLGGEIEEVFLTMGPYDFVSVGRFPDDETYAEFTLRVTQEGVEETQTLKALDEDTYQSIIASLQG